MHGSNQILAKSSAVFDTLSLLMQRVKNRRWATKSNSIIVWELALLFASVALSVIICQLLPEPERKLPSVIIPLGDFLRMFPDSVRNMFHRLFQLIDNIVMMLVWPWRFLWAQLDKILRKLGLRAVLGHIFGPLFRLIGRFFELLLNGLIGLRNWLGNFWHNIWDLFIFRSLRALLRWLFEPFLWIGNVMATLSVGFVHFFAALIKGLELPLPQFLKAKLAFLGPILRFPFTLLRWLLQFIPFLLMSLFRTLGHILRMIKHMTVMEMLKFWFVKLGTWFQHIYFRFVLFLHQLHFPGFEAVKMILRFPFRLIQWVYSFVLFIILSLWRLIVHLFSLQRLVDWWDNLCVPDGSYCGEILKREISELSQSIKELKDEIHNLKLSQQ